MADRACRILLTVDGAFLALVGAVQIVFELLSHYRGGGPLGDTVRDVTADDRLG